MNNLCLHFKPNFVSFSSLSLSWPLFLICFSSIFYHNSILSCNHLSSCHAAISNKYLQYLCEAWDFGRKRGDTVQNFVKTESLDQEKLRGIPWTFVKYREIVFPTFIYFHESCRNSANIRQQLTVFPSDFNIIYLKYFGILQNLMKNYEILWKFTKIYESYDIPRYFLSQITHFCFVSSNYKVLLAFCDFVPWQMKFFCLLLYHFAFRRHQQIFCHCQTKGDFFNIADT